MADNIEKLKEYPLEDAGKRVGWASVTTRNNLHGDQLVEVNVVTATVGHNGAWQGIIEQHDPDDELDVVYYPSYEGFFAIAGISTTLSSMKLSKEEFWNTEFNLSYRSAENASIAADEVFLKNVSARDNRIWANSQAELVDNLKQLLADAGKTEYYPQLYYWLNGAIARNDERGVFETYGIDELLAPDASMAETTKEQLEAARGITKTLHELMEEDRRIRQRLTVFSDIPAADVPDSFTNSRRFAHEHEKAIRDYAAKLAVRRTIYLPVGSRPRGRSWPYMDAENADEQVAFGYELNALKEQNVAPANHELGREITELSDRYHHATAGATRLHDLSTLEART